MICREVIKKRQAEEIKAIRTDAIDKVRKVATMLKEKYGAKRVILFGSIIKSDYLHEKTDIVRGLKSQDFLKAGADACKISGHFDVDIVPAAIAHKKYSEEGIGGGN